MKANIEVSDRKEADAIRTGLDDAAARALVVVMGVLLPLSKRARKRALTYVTDLLDEQEGNGAG